MPMRKIDYIVWKSPLSQADSCSGQCGMRLQCGVQDGMNVKMCGLLICGVLLFSGCVGTQVMDTMENKTKIRKDGCIHSQILSKHIKDSVQDSRIARQRWIHKSTSYNYDSCFPPTFCLLNSLLGISKVLLVHTLDRNNSVRVPNYLATNGCKMRCTIADFWREILSVWRAVCVVTILCFPAENLSTAMHICLLFIASRRSVLAAMSTWCYVN